MDRQYRHSMLVETTHDELARQRFVLRLRQYVAADMMPGLNDVYQGAVEPGFVRQHGRPSKDRREVSRAMERHPFHQAWSSLNVSTQRMIWASVQDSVDRQIGELNRKAKVRTPRGSVRVDPEMPIPRYISAVDIHAMPGNYHTLYGADDVYQGALYDRGAYIYAMGGRGPLHDSYGHDVIAYLRNARPGFSPRRILDMGCGVGAATGPLAKEFPKAEVHGIDVGAAMVRYGHARAEALGLKIHFSQQNMERTDFEDESFDLVYSCIAMHETSSKAFRNYLRETKRLLLPGGMAVHVEFAHYSGKTPYEQFVGDWNTHYNAEPFINTLGDTDWKGEAVRAGFSANAVSVVPLSDYIPGHFHFVLDCRKPE